MVKAYWSQIGLRALSDAAKFLHIDSTCNLLIALVGALGAILALYFWGSHDAATDELVARSAVAGLIILLFPLVYVWKFVTAPARIKCEQDQHILDLKTNVELLKDSMKPRLVFGEIKEVIRYDPESQTSFDRTIIDIINTGNEMFRECAVFVERVVFDDGSLVEPRSQLRTEARHEDGVVGRFKLSPNISKSIVLIEKADGDVRNPGVYQLYLENYTLPLHRGKAGIIEIAAGAEIGQPAKLVLRFAVDEKYTLTVSTS